MKVDESFAVSVTAKPQDVLIVAKVPCTRLCGSSQHKRLAIGASDGSIIVINYDGIKLVKTLVQPCHELPVTGLSFAPIEAILHTKYDDIVISCSADYALCMIPVHGKSHVLFRLLFVLLSILALLGLWYVTLTLYSRV